MQVSVVVTVNRLLALQHRPVLGVGQSISQVSVRLPTRTPAEPKTFADY
jgi:hypothetical protein